MSRPIEKPKKGFWKGIFRPKHASDAKKQAGTETDVEDYDDPPPTRQRRLSEHDVSRTKSLTRKLSLSRNISSPAVPKPQQKLHKRHNSEPAPPKGKGPAITNDANGHVPRSATPDGPRGPWPPPGFGPEADLSLGLAMQFICRGVPVFKGHMRRIPHTRETFYSAYATVAGPHGDEHDGVNQHDAMTQLMTMRTMGPGAASNPWETVEQPSYSFYFGRLPGTVTLNQWATTASLQPPPLAIRDSGVVPREVDLVRIFGRLKDLELGIEDDDMDFLYRNLYRKFLRDPDRLLSPHKTLDKQITDLILVLSRPGYWIDFSLPKNQIVTRFIFHTPRANYEQYLKFFHQLLLSMELDLRIHSSHHSDLAKDRLLEQLPPAIRWNLALARRWRTNVRIEAFGHTADQVKLRYKLKRRQVKMIKRFAQMMKWPNLGNTLGALRHGYEASTLDAISSHAMAFFSGLVLPGPSFPFIMMNALIDIDPDEQTDDLALLIHLNPNCGFQYRNSYTYWTSTSIVGKVLGPTCHEVAGWVGPARPTPDLKRCQIARVRTRRPRQRFGEEDVLSMAERSDPLGPPTDVFPIEDYDMVGPEADDFIDEVRIELLTMKPCLDKVADPGPKWFDAAIQFAIDGVSWPLRLTYDVNFICAWPCTRGPHPLFYDYTFLKVKADEIIAIRDWAGLYGAKSRVNMDVHKAASVRSSVHEDEDTTSDSTTGESDRKAPKGRPASATPSANSNGHVNFANGYGAEYGSEHEMDDKEKVLVIEAFGVPDNEVLARAWCAHWGMSAVVADISRTCMACAVRQAYAAALTVVILIDDQENAYYDD